MKKIFTLIIFLGSFLYSCELCSLGKPMADVDIFLDVCSKDIRSLTLTYSLSKQFSEQLISSNKSMDKLVNSVDNIFLDNALYLELYIPDFKSRISENQIIKSIKSYGSRIENGRVVFTVVLGEFKFKRGLKGIIFNFNDSSGNFIFFINKQIVISPFSNVYLKDSSRIYTSKAVLFFQGNEIGGLDVYEHKADSSIFDIFEKITGYYVDYYRMISQQLEEKLSGSSGFTGLFVLFFMSIIYGIFHSLAPGHGKSLVGLYATSEIGGYAKSLKIAFIISISHILSSYLIASILFFFSKEIIFSASYENLFTMFVGVSIVILSLLGIRKRFSLNNSCGCSSCCMNKQDTVFAISIGLMPCIGVVMFFILVYKFGDFYSGLFSALGIFVGMFLIMSISSCFGFLIKSKFLEKFDVYRKAIEVIVFILLLMFGVLMFFSALLA